MKNPFKFFDIVALIAMIGFSLAACKESKPSALVGKWEQLNFERIRGESYDARQIPKKMELFKDGTGVVDGRSASWKVENNERFILSIVGGVIAFAYDFYVDTEVIGSGTELILFDGFLDGYYDTNGNRLNNLPNRIAIFRKEE